MEITLDSIKSRRVANDRRRFIRITAIILAGIFILVGMRAYCAYMQHVNNGLIEQNSYIRAEIDSLNGQISEQLNVTRVERVAMDKYGMVFPTAENTINLGEVKESDDTLAATIKSEAYN